MPHDLNAQFAKPGLHFEIGKGGLVRGIVDTPMARGEIYLQGAHITDWTPAQHKPVLWLSESSQFEKEKPIRGGVPICFPWFGPNAKNPSSPAHGYARIVQWQMASTHVDTHGEVAIHMQTRIGDFSLRYEAIFGSMLKMTLKTHLVSTATLPASFEDALHTYLSVGDVRSISIDGLESASFIDKMDGGGTKPASAKAIHFDCETDRVYFDTETDCILNDSIMNRRIRVAKSGSSSTVIWNPWIDKSKRMADFGDDEWPNMVCIESANVASNRVQLDPGMSHSTTAILSVEWSPPTVT